MPAIRDLRERRFASDAGIAIGPILFIIAILAILAAAIAAGSGSFTSGTTSESNSTKAAALIQIGDTLKVGMDRLMMENSVDFNSVVINPQDTNSSTSLFSPSGGGISLPSVTMANNPATDVWFYPTASIPGVGSGTAPDRLAMLSVAQGVCDQINLKADALNVTPPASDIGDPSTGALSPSLASTWPNVLYGKTIGCVAGTSPPTFWFYQVLAVQ